MDLGQISHYLADYFTYPHNKIYPGSLKDHCSYEEKLKRDLRRYIRTDAANRIKQIIWNLTVPEIFAILSRNPMMIIL